MRELGVVPSLAPSGLGTEGLLGIFDTIPHDIVLHRKTRGKFKL